MQNLVASLLCCYTSHGNLSTFDLTIFFNIWVLWKEDSRLFTLIFSSISSSFFSIACFSSRLIYYYVTANIFITALVGTTAWFGEIILKKPEKCLEFSDLARKLIRKTFKELPLPPRHVCRKISAGVDGGLSGGSSVHRPRSEDTNSVYINVQLKMFFTHARRLI